LTIIIKNISPRGKLWTQITKVADTNHLDMSRCLRQSLQQSPRQVPDKVVDFDMTQIMKVGDVICVADFHDLCLRHVHDFVKNLSRTLLQSWRNGIWAIHSSMSSSCKLKVNTMQCMLANSKTCSYGLKKGTGESRNFPTDAANYT